MLNVEKYSGYIAKAIINCKKSDYIVCSCCAQKEMCEQLKNVEHIKKWLFKEWKPHLTKDEKSILRNLPKKYKYITRDSYGRIWIHENRPCKYPLVWDTVGNDGYILEIYNHLFQFIKWEDEEPYNIEELLKDK